jgi:hypothetical protein
VGRTFSADAHGQAGGPKGPLRRAAEPRGGGNGGVPLTAASAHSRVPPPERRAAGVDRATAAGRRHVPRALAAGQWQRQGQRAADSFVRGYPTPARAGVVGATRPAVPTITEMVIMLFRSLMIGFCRPRMKQPELRVTPLCSATQRASRTDYS